MWFLETSELNFAKIGTMGGAQSADVENEDCIMQSFEPSICEMHAEKPPIGQEAGERAKGRSARGGKESNLMQFDTS